MLQQRQEAARLPLFKYAVPVLGIANTAIRHSAPRRPDVALHDDSHCSYTSKECRLKRDASNEIVTLVSNHEMISIQARTEHPTSRQTIKWPHVQERHEGNARADRAECSGSAISYPHAPSTDSKSSSDRWSCAQGSTTIQQ